MCAKSFPEDGKNLHAGLLHGRADLALDVFAEWDSKMERKSRSMTQVIDYRGAIV